MPALSSGLALNPVVHRKCFLQLPMCRLSSEYSVYYQSYMYYCDPCYTYEETEAHNVTCPKSCRQWEFKPSLAPELIFPILCRLSHTSDSPIRIRKRLSTWENWYQIHSDTKIVGLLNNVQNVAEFSKECHAPSFQLHCLQMTLLWSCDALSETVSSDTRYAPI